MRPRRLRPRRRRRASGPRLTDRDVEILRWVARHGVVTIEDVALWFFWREAERRPGIWATYRRLSALRWLGLLLLDKPFANQPSVLRVTREGARLADAGVGPAPLVLSELKHSLAIVRVTESMLTEHPGAELTTERELRAGRGAWPRCGCWSCSWTRSTCRPGRAVPRRACWWGYDEQGHRVLLDVSLGQRERYEDWLGMGRGLIRRGLRTPMLIVTDGAPGAVRAIEELWPEAARQRCTVHRLRNVLGELPKRQELHDRVQAAYWRTLDEANSATDGEGRLRQVVGELGRQYPSAAACLAEDLPALCVHLDYPCACANGCGAPTSWSAPSVKSDDWSR